MPPNEYLGIYGEINNGAHQKAADLISAPSLVWHQAFWNSQHGEARNARAKRIETFLKDLEQHIRQRQNTHLSLSEPIEIQPDDRVRVITFTFRWEGLRAKIRAEVHTEYLALTSMIDASVDLTGGDENVLRELAARQTPYAEVQAHLKAFIAHAGPLPEGAPSPAKTLSEAHLYLYTTVWKDFFGQILNVGHHFRVDPANRTQCRVLIGLKFAEFKGLITCERYPDTVEEEEAERALERDATLILSTALESQLMAEPFKRRKKEEDRTAWQRVGFPSIYWARRRIESVWPFLNLAAVEAEEQAQPFAGRTEFTVSRLLGGRVIYASALGPQPQVATWQNERPLLFYLHSVTQCERQIGRLVDHLCQLGTLRLAAIIALPALKRVSDQLWNVEARVRDTRHQVHEFIRNAEALERDEPERKRLQRGILDGLEAIHSTMAQLSLGQPPGSEKFDPNLEIGDASIEYRLVRSQYYQRQFLEHIDALRILPLEGYQPYDRFVRRRLQSAFNFIAAIQARIEQIKAEWRALDQLYLTNAVTILASTIKAQQADLTNLSAQGVSVQGRTAEIQKDVSDIQVWGEFILIAVLVPYYLTSLLMHLFGCGEEKGYCATHLGFPPLDFAATLIVGVWGAAIIGALFRLRDSIQKASNRAAGRSPPASPRPLADSGPG